jgi:RNA polymerase sigma-70 factor (ECF subfamily)
MGDCARGDHGAFRRVVAAHQSRVFAYLGRMGLDRASAEDVAQEAFLRVWRHAGRYDAAAASPATWILTIARNLALSHLSKPARRAEIQGLDASDIAASDARAADEDMIARERRERLARALEALSPAERSLIGASYDEGLSLADIARLEGCTVGAAKTRLHRAREKLKRFLETSDG